MTQVTTREVLQELASAPIGSCELQAQADRQHQAELRGASSKRARAPELTETVKRVAKVWLPQGRKVTSRQDSAEKIAAFNAKQIDIEDAIEAAGGQRGKARQ
jgi:hypothetical protein